MNESQHNIVFFGLLCLLTLGLYIGFTTPIVCLLLMFFLLVKTSKHTAGFFLLMYGGVLGGTIRTMFPFVPLYGTLLNLIGIFLIRDVLKEMFRNGRNSISALIMIFVIFFITYIYGAHTEYANSKMLMIVQNGLLFFCGYCLLDKSDKMQIKDIVMLLLLTSIYLISYAEANYNIVPGSFFDFNWFRDGTSVYHYVTGEDLLVDYQEVGMDATYAMALIYSMKNRPKNTYFYVGLALFLTLVSGARQSLLAFIMVIFMRHAIFNEARSFKKILLFSFSIVFLIVVYEILQSSSIDAVTNTIENSDDDERIIIWLLSLNLFMENPILGSGLGGFPIYAVDYPWPHNFFLEVLCECGLFGLISMTIIVAIYVIRNKVNIKHLTRSGIYFFLSLTALFIRVMVSGDFSLSVSMFSAIFATSGIMYLNSKKV